MDNRQERFLKFSLNSSDPIVAGSKRSEIVIRHEPKPFIERTYYFKIFVPSQKNNDIIPEIIAQWHGTPDKMLGEAWRSPPIALLISNNQFVLNIFYSSKKVNTNSESKFRQLLLGSVTKNKWISWKIHIKFSYSAEGIIEIWRDTTKIMDYNGPNYYNDIQGPYFKIGIYKWQWKNYKGKNNLKSEIFFDDIEIK
ncbi:polysaccharide lyase [Zhouia sp. PK063]|uniref:polysaccharide lyase n=1 Tax=Zhouia sp. PK063 TaxID=3373602 RepID=UPI0037887D0E